MDRIADLLDRHLELYQKAESIAGGEHSENGMIVLITMALDSGVDSAILKAIVNRSKGMSRGAVRALISAAEIIQLRDISPSLGLEFIYDCMDREASRPQILKGIKLLANPEWQNEEYEYLRDEIWSVIDSSRSRSAARGEQQRIMRGRHNNDRRERRHARPASPAGENRRNPK